MAQAVGRQPIIAEAGFLVRVAHMGFLVDIVAQEKVFLRVIRFYSDNIISTWLSILIYLFEDEQ
jgi:hypothetical protein